MLSHKPLVYNVLGLLFVGQTQCTRVNAELPEHSNY